MLDLFERSEREIAVDELHHATAIYTAEPVVDQLLDALDWPRGNRRLVDTSCGDGAFLARAIERLLEAVPDIDDAHLSHVIAGWEIHFHAVAQARSRIAEVIECHGRATAAARALAALIVTEGDFLVDAPMQGTWDCITGNPPYLRYAHLPEHFRRLYEATMPEHAQADMLHSFLDRSMRVLNPDGEIALVTSDRWLTNQSAAGLREVLGQRLGVVQLERLDSSTSFYRPKQRKAGTPPRIHPVAIVLRHAGQGAMPLGRAPLYPDTFGQSASPESGPTLGELAQVRIAPWLGTPGIFLVDDDVARTLPREHLVSAVDTDDIKDGQLGTPTRMAIRTTRDSEPPPEVMAHLDAQLHRMCARGRRNPRWVAPEPFERFDLSQPCLLVPRIARSLRPVRVPAGVLPVNHNLSIVSAGSLDLDTVEQQLNRPEAMQWVARRAPRLENGYYSLTTTLLRELPLALG